MTFPVNRKQMNHGTGIESGSWCFEEFMFSDCVFGLATVKYDPLWLKQDAEFVFLCRRVEDLHVFDDDGNDVPIPPESRMELNDMVLEAFENDIDHVQAMEMGEL